MEVVKIDNKSTGKSIDFLGIGLDVLIPVILDGVIFRGTKGRALKLLGTVVAQQGIKFLAKSKTVDNILDIVEEWVKPASASNIVKSYPSAEEAIIVGSGKKRTKTKPEDYADPEREMYL